MERRTDIEIAKKYFGKDFIGIDEISKIALELEIQLPKIVPQIQFTETELKLRSKDSILILGIDTMTNGKKLTLLSLREKFGISSKKFEPCFYNQDWYLKEYFMNITLERKWYIIRKKVLEETRAVQPVILEKKFIFPSAILCTYVFFVYWFLNRELLWKYDFVWCSDIDHNGDKVYVGKYTDIDGINENGFSIHRHLALRNCYAAIDVIL